MTVANGGFEIAVCGGDDAHIDGNCCFLQGRSTGCHRAVAGRQRCDRLKRTKSTVDAAVFGIARSANALGMQPNEYKTKLFFVAIPGIEWGNTATGNHLNLAGLRVLPPDTIKDQDYDQIYAWARNNAEFVVLNHPNSWSGKPNRNKTVGNFGENLFPNTSAFQTTAGLTVRLISIITTVWFT
jgi:hypothetical protein